MKDLMQKGFSAGLGLVLVSKERLEKTVQELVKKGEVSPSTSKELIQKLISRGEAEQKELDEALRKHIKKNLHRLDVATRDELEAMEQRIRMLENRLTEWEKKNQPSA